MAQRLKEVRDAIEALRVAARDEGDSHRGETADRLGRDFENIESVQELRAAARHARKLYSGGLGSFSDVGSPGMDSAVNRLRRALRRAVSIL